MTTRRAGQGKASRPKGRPVTGSSNVGSVGDRVDEAFARFSRSAGTTPPAAPPITVEVTVRLQAVALTEADGRYSVIVPGLPGGGAVGRTMERARANLVDAAEGA